MPFACVKVRCGLGELFAECLSLAADFSKAFSYALLWERAVGREVEEVILFRLKRLQPVLELATSKVLGVRLITERGFEVLAHNLDELGAELDGLVVLFDCGFDVVDVHVGCVAGAVLGAAAEEVPVLAAVPSDGALLDEASVGLPFEAAVSAPQAALEVMRVDTATLVGDATSAEHALDMVEQPLVNERFVPAFVDLAFVGDLTDVVPVAEHPLNLRIRDRPGRATCCRASGESAVREFIGDVLE
nr:hypothetical protein [Microbacterium saccharophilum]